MGIRNREPSLATAVRELLGQLDKHAPDDGEGADLVLVGRDALEELIRAVRPALKGSMHARIQEVQREASELFAGLDRLFGVPTAGRFAVAGPSDKVTPGPQEFAPAFEVVRCPKEYGEECSVIHSSAPHHHFRDADGTVKVHESVPKEEAHSECLDDRCPGPAVLRKVEPLPDLEQCGEAHPLNGHVVCSLNTEHVGFSQHSSESGERWA